MITVILACAGKGERFGQSLPKQFLPLLDKPIYLHPLIIFEEHPKVENIVIAGPKFFLPKIEEQVKGYNLKKVKAIVEGGKSRQQSVYRALLASPPDTKVFLVHDAARPFLTPLLVDRVIEATLSRRVVIPVLPCRDALVKAEDKLIKDYLDRKEVYLVQTPQGIDAKIFKKCLEMAEREKKDFPDEGSLLLHYGYQITFVLGSFFNLKITYPEDLVVAEILMKGKIQGDPNLWT